MSRERYRSAQLSSAKPIRWYHYVILIYVESVLLKSLNTICDKDSHILFRLIVPVHVQVLQICVGFVASRCVVDCRQKIVDRRRNFLG